MNAKSYKNQTLKGYLLLFFLIFSGVAGQTENLKSLVNLEGNWKFSIGDEPARSLPNYDDSNWQIVFVPNSWEENGFEDYNGFAWYRKSFRIVQPYNREYLYLYMGYIDDVDEVYLNGKLVGASGNFPPHTVTAYDIPRMYPIPANLLNKEGENVIAVRVFDQIDYGGITAGPVGIFVDRDQERMDVDLTGYWDFECGQSVDEGNLNCITYRKGKIFVPGFWEARGFNGLDGKVKYSKEFTYSSKLSASGKALILGVIDDNDEVYLNGERLKWMGPKRGRSWSGDLNHLSFRAYTIPSGVLNTRGANILEVMVIDHTGPGGIYKGPIGIASVELAEEMGKREYQDNRSSFEKFIDYWFD
ncbi:hypothetical protein BZG02_14740 [Labilibaculum filiforme]|uniref:Beta-galactosidase jelly roll domain-containing protein n=1 Tax=Labilibaculum filiforme TaxID=1940526 RepID=A0A2N3HV02_9BACT|nr:beta galactosidase jelly roll domain-containing protein [Labilibaculum filiforme]PKQ61879.1 hypothetical protein BZG02_14740 [Labilibaculum filiforme]